MSAIEDEMYVKLRYETRKILGRLDLASNSGVSDHWIVSWLREKAKLGAVNEWSEDGNAAFYHFKMGIVNIVLEAGYSVPEDDVESILRGLRQVYSKNK